MLDQWVEKLEDIYLPFSQKILKTFFFIVFGGHTVYPCQSFLFCEIRSPNKLPACKRALSTALGKSGRGSDSLLLSRVYILKDTYLI